MAPRDASVSKAAPKAKAASKGASSSPKGRASRKPRSGKKARRFTAEQVEARRGQVPAVSYPDLPVSARRDEIAEAIAANQVVVIAGETGSGKTTQIPKICLELGRGVAGMIGHTQPRRLAARAVAERIATELGTPLGGAVGYQVRFTEEVSPTTLVKLMTDGILLAEIQSDPDLARYDTIIIDEAHERSLNIDFLLGYLARLLPRRPDLKLIITSATIDTERFASHFDAPIIEVSGRTYPVEVRYRPLVESADDGDAPITGEPGDVSTGRIEPIDQVTGILRACEELMAEGPGDILVFLSGEGEIRDTAAAFADELGRRHIEPGGRSSVPGAVEVLPLYARLTAAEQHRIFASHSHRRIVLATNIAETSLTVPGIRYVVDPGTARISRYSNKTKVQRLPIEPISQASANQRAGRCGRVADGICIRLYSQEDFQTREQFTQPEIQRTSLASVILQMLALGLGRVEDFPFVDPPDARAVRAGAQLLAEIGAVDPRPIRGQQATRLTGIGRKLARLPIDPRLGRMLIEAQTNGCASEVLVLVAALSVQDVRERPTEKRAQADSLHARFTASTSDFLAYLTLWRYLHTQQRELSGSAFRRLCRAEFLNYLRYREWTDVVAQLRQLAKPLGLDLHRIALPDAGQIRDSSGDVAAACRELGRSADTPEAGAIHRSLLVGLLSNVGHFDERKRDYAGARGSHFIIWPGSGLHRRNPSWVMTAELVETSRLFARTVAAIEPSWIEPLAEHLVKRTYSEPYWSSRNGAAMCKEKVTLYGITLVADRPRLLSSAGGEEARELAREMFIRHGLVERQWRAHHAFLEDNARALEEAGRLEDKLRVRGLVADDDALAAFYAERVPDHVVSGRHFDSWWKKARRQTPGLLDFTRELLLGEADAAEGDYPTEWVQGDLRLAVDYAFTPGSHADGITVTIPVTVLPQVTPEGFDWLVPGMLDELVTGMIRALPKRIRRQLVPAPDVARQLVPLLEGAARGGSGGTDAVAPAGRRPSFREAFTDGVFRLRGFWIDDEAWEATDLPEHLKVLFRVRSERGAVLDESTSLEYLQRSLAPQTRSAVESVVKGAVAQALERGASVALTDDGFDRRQFASQVLAGMAGGQASGDSAQASEEAARGSGNKAADAGEAAALPTVADWPGELIPASVEASGQHGMTIRAYPALVATPGGVVLDVLADPAEQLREHTLGVTALLARAIALAEARITTRWSGDQALALAGSPYASTAALAQDMQLAAARNLAERWAAERGVAVGEVRSLRQWQDLRAWAKPRLEDEVYRIALLTAEVCARRAEALQAADAITSPALLAAASEVKAQVAALTPAGFVSATPAERLPHLPRYLRAASIRLEKAAAKPEADDALAARVADVVEKIEAARDISPARLNEARWMIEELRVSFFAQQLGTAGKVSAKRIEKLLA
ncbi:MAG: ATP-dependent RNA helicase HrpA [Actinomycetaceae bacterium]|nr:ATP-dependent RNA helicase HrpA [Actinomycetaceae bacterium]